ncbi:MAG: serine hydrolase domain-containing protein [Chitinophagaceae bacterium]
MKTVTFLSVLLSGFWSTAQITTLEKKTDTVAQLVKKLYDEQKTDSIYLLTDTSFRKKVKLSVLQNVLSQQLYPLGIISKMEFERSKADVNIYKAYMAPSAVMNLLVGLNTYGKITTLSFQPYKPEVKDSDKRKNYYHDNALLSRTDSLVHRYASEFMETGKNPGLSIGILIGTKSYFYNYGDAKKGEDVHPTRTTVFEIGSITKTFTAYLLADAVVKNKIALNDPISKYLPDSVASNKDLQGITINQLSNHTSGMPRLPLNFSYGNKNLDDPYANYDDAAMFSFLKYYHATSKPGAKYEYSNFAVGLLGVILERLNGLPLNEQYQQTIFGPLKMKNSYAAAIKDSSVTAVGYDAAGKPTNYWNFKSLAGAGAIKSTTEDLIKYAVPFALMPLSKGKYDARTLLLQNITYNQTGPKVSLAWHFDSDDKTLFTMWHNGGTGGFRSYIGIRPSKRLAVVALTNSVGEPGTDAIANQIMQELTKGIE